MAHVRPKLAWLAADRTALPYQTASVPFCLLVGWFVHRLRADRLAAAPRQAGRHRAVPPAGRPPCAAEPRASGPRASGPRHSAGGLAWTAEASSTAEASRAGEAS